MIQSFDSDLLEIVLGRVGPNLLSDKKRTQKEKEHHQSLVLIKITT